MYEKTEVNKVLLMIIFVISILTIYTINYVTNTLFVLLVNAIITLFFHSMTVGVSRNRIYWYFGLGFFRNEVELADIIQISRYKTTLFQGIGIRMLKDGWLYNVSWGAALKFTLINGKKFYLGWQDSETLEELLKSNKS